MGRGRAKGKKHNVASQDDPGSGEEEKIPAQKRRGRPQKPLKDDVDEEDFEVQKIEDDGSEEDTTGTPNKDANGKKRKRNSPGAEKVEEAKKEENVDVTKSSVEDESNVCRSIRPNRNRRKNTPRRAAEAVVECS
ncbi:uncharacterized protein LOC127258909 [Andrographis paniculata]|uniref:uncharacterized protein LOC127258909 n=1 Tax=Andrographis paniculata TaxID=175694 RepID=UPI0021E99DB3|nr:uncharacterized protein LOC127258909 [Andrographis paniculata]